MTYIEPNRNNVGYYIDADHIQTQQHPYHSPSNTHLDNVRGYKTYYVDGEMPSSTNKELYYYENSAVGESKKPGNVLFRPPEQNTGKKRDRSTIYDEDHYTLARLPSSESNEDVRTHNQHFETADEPNKEKQDSRRCSYRCYCFTTIWLLILAVAGVAVVFLLVGGNIFIRDNANPSNGTGINALDTSLPQTSRSTEWSTKITSKSTTTPKSIKTGIALLIYNKLLENDKIRVTYQTLYILNKQI